LAGAANGFAGWGLTMIYHQTELKDAWLIELELRGDARGAFARTMCREEFAARGIGGDFVQQNLSVTAFQGTLRGMHYQRAPYPEAKLVRCIRGAVWDVIVDLRAESPTYLKHQGFTLSAENHHQLYIPAGFAHGFQTLTPDVEMTYLMSEPYAPETAGGVRFDDPVFGIAWPQPITTIADRDRAWPDYDPKVAPVF
jgi:dTDP-4-dehydrorhamnose 3,5-epimerase